MKYLILLLSSYLGFYLPTEAQMTMAGFQFGSTPDPVFNISSENGEYAFSPGVIKGSFNNFVIGGGLGLAESAVHMGIHLSVANAVIESETGTFRLKGLAPTWHTHLYLNPQNALSFGILIRMGFGSMRTSFTDTLNFGLEETDGPYDIAVKYRGISYFVGLGLRYVLPNDNLALFANGVYGIQAQKPKTITVNGDEYAADDFDGLDLNTAAIEFGVYYYFGK
ncbi:MAG: hypothetical protein ACK5XV_10755 [Flavobacteriales bacterium]|jgi:hypothetical protein